MAKFLAHHLYDFIHNASYVVLFVGLLMLLWGWFYRRRIRNVVHSWKKSQMVMITVTAFILNFTFFVLACFFFVGYVGRIDDLNHIPKSADTMLQLGIDSLVLLAGSLLVYFGLHFFYTQYLTPEGIVLRPGVQPGTREYMLRWAEVKDYYVHSDYPASYYHFLTQTSRGVVTKMSIKVPYYAQPKFEYLLQSYLEQHEELRAHRKGLVRKPSRSDLN